MQSMTRVWRGILEANHVVTAAILDRDWPCVPGSKNTIPPLSGRNTFWWYTHVFVLFSLSNLVSRFCVMWMKLVGMFPHTLSVICQDSGCPTPLLILTTSILRWSSTTGLGRDWMVQQGSGMEHRTRRVKQAQVQPFSSEVNLSLPVIWHILLLGHRFPIDGLGNYRGRSWGELGAIDYWRGATQHYLPDIEWICSIQCRVLRDASSYRDLPHCSGHKFGFCRERE